jgi:serine/threonine protein kinase
MIGRTVSHYQIVERLGEGGMGVVYKARDTRLNRFVAIKVLPPDKGTHDRRLRFAREAQAASALNHPNIITIYDIVEEDGADFIVMEYVHGKMLADLIGRKGFRVQDALKYAVQIAEGLAKAHSAGIIHRDLKPSNVAVSPDGQVKILDFGLAKLTEPGTNELGETATLRPDQPLETVEGTIVGTAAYMSPEQVEGKPLDARSDIFSFGSVLYEMVTGRRAFRGVSTISTLSAILKEHPKPVGAVIPDADHELEKIINRCLRKAPERRFQCMADVKIVLRDIEEESGSGLQMRTARAPRRLVWASMFMLLLLAGLVAWRASHVPEQEPLRALALTTLPGVESYPSFSPDGNHVVFTWNGRKQDNPDIYVQQIGSGNPLQLTTDGRADYNPVWSPDDRWIAFLRESSPDSSELRLIPPLGGPERHVADVHQRGRFQSPPYLAWCPESDCLVVTHSPGAGRGNALFVISLETGEKRQLTHPHGSVSDIHPAISPDGRFLIFRRHAGDGIGELYAVRLGTGSVPVDEPRRLTSAALNANYPAWMPDSREILFSSNGALWRLAVQGQRPPSRLPFVGEDALMPAISRPRPGKLPRLVYVRSFKDSNIWRTDTAPVHRAVPSAPLPAISSSRADTFPSFSPDGRRVAFESDRSGNNEIWLTDPDGSNTVQLTFLGAACGAPSWSPDGRLITFHSNAGGQWWAYLIPSTGGKPRRLSSRLANEGWPSFSRDNKWVYFSSLQSGENQIWKMPIAGGEAVQVTFNGGIQALESSDGKNLYYTTGFEQTSTLWRMHTSAGAPLKVLDGVVGFVVVGRGLYCIRNLSTENRLEFSSFEALKPAVLVNDLGKVDGALTGSPDGRSLLYTRVDSSVDDLILVEKFR